MLLKRRLIRYIFLIILSCIIYHNAIYVLQYNQHENNFEEHQRFVTKKENQINFDFGNSNEFIEPTLRQSRNDSSIVTEDKKLTGSVSVDDLSAWLQISSDIYIYSAYWENRKEIENAPFVKTIGMIRYNETHLIKEHNIRWTGIVKNGSLEISCYLWYGNQISPVKGEVQAFVFEEAHTTFVGAFINCIDASTHSNSSTDAKTNKLIPYAVSFVPNDISNYPHKLIHIANLKYPKNKGNFYSVCVRPLYGPFNDSKSLIQFLIYYKLVLNIDKFYFYEFALTLNIKKILQELRILGLEIELLKWNLPTGNWDELWDFGSLASLNDCLYRTLVDGFNYTLFVDIDEFIVPRVKEDMIKDIYSKTLKQKRGILGDAVMVLNGFFCSDFKNDKSTSLNTNEILPIFKYIKREGRLWPPKERSKLIIQPSYVISVGHHMVHKFVNSKLKNHPSPKTLSALHHYRLCGDLRHGIHNNGPKVIEGILDTDKSIFKFKNRILNSNLYKYYETELT